MTANRRGRCSAGTVGYWLPMFFGLQEWRLGFQPYVRIAISDWGAPSVALGVRPRSCRRGVEKRRDQRLSAAARPDEKLDNLAGHQSRARERRLPLGGRRKREVYALPPNGARGAPPDGVGWLTSPARDSYHLVGLTPDETDQDGNVTNDLWISTAGPPGVPSHCAAAPATGGGLRIAGGPGDEWGPERPRTDRIQPEALCRVPGRRRRRTRRRRRA